MKASALRLLDPFYDQFSVLYRGLVIQFLFNSNLIIKYDVRLIISVILSPVMFLHLWREKVSDLRTE